MEWVLIVLCIMDELITWLRQQLDDEALWATHAGNEGPWFTRDQIQHGLRTGSLADVEHIARWDPARVLAEVEAKRCTLDEHQPDANGECGTCHEPGMDRNQIWPCTTVRLLAQPYAGQPGWREEWQLSVPA